MKCDSLSLSSICFLTIFLHRLVVALAVIVVPVTYLLWIFADGCQPYFPFISDMDTQPSSTYGFTIGICISGILLFFAEVCMHKVRYEYLISNNQNGQNIIALQENETIENGETWKGRGENQDKGHAITDHDTVRIEEGRMTQTENKVMIYLSPCYNRLTSFLGLSTAFYLALIAFLLFTYFSFCFCFSSLL